MNYLGKFNDIFQDMLHELVSVFPKDSELRLYDFGLRSVLGSDENVVCNIFHNQVAVPFGTQIKCRDEQFFINKSYEEYDGDGYQGVTDVITKIKNCWRELSNDNKDIIWKYLQILLTLSTKINS